MIVDRSAASTEGSGVFKVSRVDTVGDTVFSRAFTYRPRREDRGSASWLVVRPDGTAAGIVSLPGDAEIEWSADGVIWTVEEDELDVPWLVRYRLSPGG